MDSDRVSRLGSTWNITRPACPGVFVFGFSVFWRPVRRTRRICRALRRRLGLSRLDRLAGCLFARTFDRGGLRFWQSSTRSIRAFVSRRGSQRWRGISGQRPGRLSFSEGRSSGRYRCWHITPTPTHRICRYRHRLAPRRPGTQLFCDDPAPLLPRSPAETRFSRVLAWSAPFPEPLLR